MESRCRAHSARCRRCICSQLTSNLSFSYFIQSRLNRLLILIFSIDVDLLSFVAFFVVAGPVVVVADRLHGLAHGNTILYYTLCLGCQFFSPFRFVLVIFVLFLFYFIFCCLFFVLTQHAVRSFSSCCFFPFYADYIIESVWYIKHYISLYTMFWLKLPKETD